MPIAFIFERENSMKAPVVMFGYNRLELQSMVMKCFSECEGAAERDIFVFLDGPRKNLDNVESDKIKNMLEGYKTKMFPRMRIIKRERNYGCRENIVQGITDVLEKYGRAIVIEDDILVSKTFLTFMDSALDFYEGDKRIWCINGFQKYIFKLPKDYKHDVYLAYTNCVWGWATWQNRWAQVDFDMRDYPDYIKSPANVKKLNEVSYILKTLLDSQYRGTLKAWDAQCWFHMVKNDLYAIEPKYQMSKNIGCIPNSEHYSSVDPFMLTQKFYNFMPRLEHGLPLDERILRQFKYCALNPNVFVRLWRKVWRMVVGLIQKPCYVPVDAVDRV